MTGLNSGRVDARAILRGEILRWNPTLNLVSRNDTENQLDRLLDQCEAGFETLQIALSRLEFDACRMSYADIGSGNGLPGVLWVESLRRLGAFGPNWLVEPRERRAWFLSRVVRVTGGPASVAAVRWGEPLPHATTPGDVLISLKALRLTEPEILSGVVGSFGQNEVETNSPRRIVIVRFLAPHETGGANLDRELLLDAGCDPWHRSAREILSGPGVRLLLTAYSRT